MDIFFSSVDWQHYIPVHLDMHTNMETTFLPCFAGMPKLCVCVGVGVGIGVSVGVGIGVSVGVAFHS